VREGWRPRKRGREGGRGEKGKEREGNRGEGGGSGTEVYKIFCFRLPSLHPPSSDPPPVSALLLVSPLFLLPSSCFCCVPYRRLSRHGDDRRLHQEHGRTRRGRRLHSAGRGTCQGGGRQKWRGRERIEMSPKVTQGRHSLQCDGRGMLYRECFTDRTEH